MLKPWLEAKRDQTFPDPQNFTDELSFTYAAKVTSIYKKVVSEILAEINKRVDEAKYYQAKERGEIKENFDIGREEGEIKDVSES